MQDFKAREVYTIYIIYVILSFLKKVLPHDVLSHLNILEYFMWIIPSSVRPHFTAFIISYFVCTFHSYTNIERFPRMCTQLNSAGIHYGDVATTILSNSWILWSFLAMVALIPLIFTCCDSILSSSSFLLSSKSLNVSSFSSFSSPISSLSRIRDRHSSDSLDICAI